MKKIFISYSDTDKNKMRAIERLIYSTDFLKPIIIADNRQALTHLTEKVKTGIFECDYFLPILTRNSISTQWINQEIGFATAINRKAIPIVEIQVLDLLKGFIHKQLDLSYAFEGNKSNSRSEASKFTAKAKTLINDILIDNDVQPKKLTIESLFPGKWNCIYTATDFNGVDQNVEIKEGNKYFINGRHWFNLDKISIDIKNKAFTYRKVGLENDTRRLIGEMKIIELGKRYEGSENSEISISYYRLD